MKNTHLFGILMILTGILFSLYLDDRIGELNRQNKKLAHENLGLGQKINQLEWGMDSLTGQVSSLENMDIKTLTGTLQSSVYKLMVGTEVPRLPSMEEFESEIAQTTDEEEIPVRDDSIQWASGTAFCLYRGDLVLTNAHVLGDNPRIAILEDDQGNYYPVKRVVLYDTLLDYALLLVPGLNGKALEIADERPELNARVMTMGNPLNLDFTPSDGRITGLRMDGLVLQINLPVTYGNSGGPLIRSDGKVIGLVFGGLNISGQLNFAVNIHHIHDDLADKLSRMQNKEEPETYTAPGRSVYDVAGFGRSRPVGVKLPADSIPASFLVAFAGLEANPN